MDDILGNFDELVSNLDTLLISQTDKREKAINLSKRITELELKITEDIALLDDHIKATTIVSGVSDKNMENVLNTITGVINRALAVLFPKDVRYIKLAHFMYHNKYPHIKIELYAGKNARKTKFNVTGAGLKQIVSFLFTVSLIDTRKGRPLVILDEVLNGLHPSAKGIITELLKSLSNRFQFIIVEYGLDLGQMVEVVRQSSYSELRELPEGSTYYLDLAKTVAQTSTSGYYSEVSG